MRQFHRTKQHIYNPSINIYKMQGLISQDNSFSIKKADSIPMIDISRFGFSKMLGKGKTPLFPLIIKGKKFSGKAENKIKKAGGKCILIP